MNHLNYVNKKGAQVGLKCQQKRGLKTIEFQGFLIHSDWLKNLREI